ncbi:hypothetical protein JMJ35_006719 [Cladonia borealis]|uniref:Uncharacterized protein n=1 Tax=Cladonia borealis TaxID=184061 RepID=A0AA39V0P3_9LECA|nr:hypothetical protein JMJ35_006719 [Cladonia borealis]
MSYPQIMFSKQLVNDVVAPSEYITMIQPIAKSVFLVTNDFSQQDLDDFAPLFNSGIQDKWVSNVYNPTGKFKVVEPATPLEVPMIGVSPGLLQTRPDILSKDAPSLAYIFLVQGKNAGERTKAVAKVTRHAAAAAMFHELINGYSIVFSGAILTCNVAKIFPPTPMNIKLKFFKVEDIAGLHSVALEKDNKRQGNSIGVWC